MIRGLIRCSAMRGRVLAISMSLVAACSTNSNNNNNNNGMDAGAGDATAPDSTRVTLADGELQGSVVGSSRQFLGIPYAKPPVGALRWQPPQPPDKWTTPRDATKFGKRCAQLLNQVLQNAASSDEDCLYLNVWTPSPAPSAALPVMVWIHGGFNRNGSASEPVPFAQASGTEFYSGESLSSHGVVVVTLNYRLGAFGFFPHPGLAADAGGESGNQGLKDQQLALKWVHDNIAKFGGDPASVTLFGESAGSTDVCLHLASPGSAGLFQRAISESDGCTTVQTPKATAETAAKKLATDLGCTGADADVITCLRGKAVADIMASPDIAGSIGFGVDIDGKFLPDQPRAIYNAGNSAKVPYLMGSNTDEGTLFLPATPPATEADYQAFITARFGASLVTPIENVYPLANFAGATPSPAAAATARVIGDSMIVCNTFDTAARVVANGQKVHMYNFGVKTVVPGLNFGAAHGSELFLVFGNSTTFTADTKAVSDVMQRYWTNFAKTGDPNGGSDPQWPEFTAAANVRLNFDVTPSTTPTTVNNFRAPECTFWRQVYDQQYAAAVPAP